MTDQQRMHLIPGAQGSQSNGGQLAGAQGPFEFPAYGLAAAAMAASQSRVYAPSGFVPSGRFLGQNAASVTDILLGGAFPSQGDSIQQVGGGYQDFSSVLEASLFSPAILSLPGKDHTFPCKLHKILSDPQYSEYIAWLPHGRSWRVLKAKPFEEKVLPKFFRHGKYASFMRQVNGWGFKRVTSQGIDHNSYYHELFLRGFPKLSEKIRRPTKSTPVVNTTQPDFHLMSMYAPLPTASRETPVVTSASASPTNNYTSGSDFDRSGLISSSDDYAVSAPNGGSDSCPSQQDSGASSSNDGPRDDSGASAFEGLDPSVNTERNNGSDVYDPNRFSDQGQTRRQDNTAYDFSLNGSSNADRQLFQDLTGFSASLPSVGGLPGGTLQEPSAVRQLPFLPGRGNVGVGLNAAGAFAPAPIGQAMAGSADALMNHFSSASHPLTAVNLGYLSLQNHLAQSQALLAQMKAFQEQMGIQTIGAAQVGGQTSNDQERLS